MKDENKNEIDTDASAAGAAAAASAAATVATTVKTVVTARAAGDAATAAPAAEAFVSNLCLFSFFILNFILIYRFFLVTAANS